MPVFDRELLFQKLAAKDWGFIAGTMLENPSLIESDPIVAQAIAIFETEFLSVTKPMNSWEKMEAFESMGPVVDRKRGLFSDAFVRDFVESKLLALRETGSDRLLSFASANQHYPLAVDILHELKKEKPEKIIEALKPEISVKKTETHNGPVKTMSLFKSQQEHFFFEAVKDAFPTYHHYPNVAVSCVLNFDEIKGNLNSLEKEYFFKAIVDCVVFDSSNNYEPKYFIELDSVYHESKKAKINDEMKDNIFKAANVELIRVRGSKDERPTKEYFRDLVVELMRNL